VINHTLAVTGAQIITDTNSPQDPVASYFYDNATQELISYDTPDIVKIKAQYINNQSLAGAMFWEVCHI
jgi:chitinase